MPNKANLLPPAMMPIPTQATRDGFGQGLVKAAQQDPRMVVVSADLAESLRLLDFKHQFPDRFIEVGVAEQNAMGVAAGLALAGKIPFICSFAVFSPGRNWEQLRQSICEANLNVKVIGGHGGLETGPDGASHQALEDIALTRVLPNMTVVVPADADQARKATVAIAQLSGPCYLRLSREKTAKIDDLLKNQFDKNPNFAHPTYVQNQHFQLAKAQLLTTGQDVTIIACGSMVQESLLAAQQLAKVGVQARVINFHTIKPLDKEILIKAAQETKKIITIEDHQINGGLGGAVAEFLSTASPVPVLRLGVQDQFGQSGSAKELKEKYHLDAEAIVRAIKEF